PCVDCKDQNTGVKTCVQLAIQPDKNAKCRATIKPVVDPKVAQAAPSTSPTMDQNDFKVVILQEPCFDRGITLRAWAYSMNTTMPSNPKDYTYSWEVDGKPMGNSQQLYCITGSIASVKVTQVSTKRVKSETVEIKYGDQTTQATESTPVIRPIAGYMKTSCFGECPAYTVWFYEDGTAAWEGHYFTTPLGKKTGKIAAADIKKIQDKARTIGFMKLQDSYPEEIIADAQATIVFMMLDGKSKQVTDVFGAPKGLKELEKIFDDVIKKQGWAKPAPMQKKLDNKPKTTAPAASGGN
ncbi:MAG: hypothetical protein JNN28_12190, partial [Saprospiraceae bacterium]|nr:hypothetical protein [Saprospiraceae bacterium]